MVWHDIGEMISMRWRVCILSFVIFSSSSATTNFGPLYQATQGRVWPKPLQQYDYSEIFKFNPERIQFNVTNHWCRLLENALFRYKNIMKNAALGPPSHFDYINDLASLRSIEVSMENPCEDMPHANMDESYNILIYESTPNDVKATLSSKSIWGMLRALETLSQISYYNGTLNQLLVRSTEISDQPRFPHRGLMIDTARHFLPVTKIKILLDALEANKMNVLHWHMVDDQSFPYKSQRYPELSEKGAYNPTYMVYNAQDIQDVVNYASMRGIRVIPEFDTPGHTLSWGKGQPNLLTECYDGHSPNGKFGPMNPANHDVYTFLENLFSEIKQRFPDSFFHLGGDEVDFTCWRSNPVIKYFMERHGMGSDYPALEAFYMKKILSIVSKQRATPIVWQEVFQNDRNLNNDTVVHIWLGDQSLMLFQVTAAGFRALLSTCWYLDQFTKDLYAGGGDWRRLYRCEPLDFPGNNHQKSLVMGGEACMWAEYVDHTNIIPRVWPRASAAAERLWSNSFNEEDAAARLEEHVCRMRMRGIEAQPPNGPSTCL